MRQIKVLVVEDSMFFREILVKSLNQDPALKVVAAVRDPFEARDAIVKYRPDVMTLDIELPRMDGIEFLRKLMPQYPIPVVMISALSNQVFDALNAGAVDFAEKPVLTDKQKLEEFVKKELPIKIKIASTARIGRLKNKIESQNLESSITREREMVVAIGASTGGTEAIASVLSEFKTDIPGVVVVQHMPEGFTGMYAERLNNQCHVRVKEARNGDKVLPGQVLIAPGGDAHMKLIRVNGAYQVDIRKGATVNGHPPTVDVLFQSVAKEAGANALGIILTGMGGDGARGLLAMRQAGARTIGQDESTCVVYGMPKVAYEIGAVEYQEKLSDIARKTYQLINRV